MNIAVLSGKGGTGKTFISVNLASVINNANYLDYDIEEPNGHLFFKPIIEDSIKVKVDIPVIEHNKCQLCNDCVNFCNFNALANTGEKIISFDKICHSCGGCKLVCPNEAISEKGKTIGAIKYGKSGNVNTYTGILDIGEQSGTPIIKKLNSFIKERGNTSIIDSPPGTACTVMDSIEYADYCIVVAEPTIFGLENFKMVLELLKLYDKPFGVIVNKDLGEINNPLKKYCDEKNIEILETINFDEKLNYYNSNAIIVSMEDKEYRELFISVYNKINEELRV